MDRHLRHRQAFSALSFLLLSAVLAVPPALAQESGSDFPVCGGGGPRPVTLTWLEAPDPESSRQLSGTRATLEASNGTDRELEAHVVVTLDVGGETLRLPLDPVTLPAGGRLLFPVELAGNGGKVPGDSTSFAEAHAFFVRTDRTTMTQAAAVPLAYYREAAGSVVVFGERELQRRLANRELPEARLLQGREEDPGSTLEMAFEVDGALYRRAPDSFDAEGALAYEQELARARRGAQDQEVDR